MSLRGKLHLLLAVFGVVITVNVLVSTWCLQIYLRQSTESYDVLMHQLARTDNIRTHLNKLNDELHRMAEPKADAQGPYHEFLHRKLDDLIVEIPETSAQQKAQKSQLLRESKRLEEANDRYVELLTNGRLDDARAYLNKTIVGEIIGPMRRAVYSGTREADDALQTTASAVGSKQGLIVVILSLNAIFAFVLAATGVHLIRNWVLAPVADLKLAAETHASGDLHYRVEPRAEDELGMLATSVNRMANSLIQYQERLIAQQRFATIGEVASAIAHNIRNPLASLRAQIQETLVGVPPNSAFHEQQTKLIENVDSLNRWLRELLMVSKRFEPACNPVLVEELVTRVVAVLQSDVERKGLEIEFREPPPEDATVHVDAALIEQALLSVLNNAVEASPPNSRIIIEVQPQSDPPDMTHLCVIDSGPGINPDVYEHISKPYFTTKPGGMGIGLHLSRRIVQAHGGDILFGDGEAGGAMVSLCLPIRPREASPTIRSFSWQPTSEPAEPVGA